jgi:hypothetical protein
MGMKEKGKMSFAPEDSEPPERWKLRKGKPKRKSYPIWIMQPRRLRDEGLLALISYFLSSLLLGGCLVFRIFSIPKKS